MNRTALIPLSLFLLVIVIATIIVSNYEIAFTNHDIIERENPAIGDGSFSGLIDHEYLSNNSSPIRKNIGLFEENTQKPSLYISMIKAKDLIVAGKYNEAKGALRTIIVFYPNNIEALSLLTGIYSLSGNYEQSHDLLKKILKIDPDNFVAQENLGIVLEEMKQYNSAIASFFKASLINPKSPLSYIHMAKIYSILNNKEEAMDNFVKAYDLLGCRIYPFTFVAAFDNIRNSPLFIEITENAKKIYKNEISNKQITDTKNTVLQK
jgi:tetratricopeptide (TPR) repeat protein